jgi:PEGA domain-containing protein
MATGSAIAERPEAPLFADGIGERVVAVDAATGDLLQILRVRPQLLQVPSFEFALRERAARLANFRHAYYARVRRIDRHPGGLAIVSDHVEGVRLSEMLRVAHARGLQIDLNAALCLLRQLVPSLALLHENARDVAHGLVAPERLIVTPRARLIVVEHVLGSAVEQLQFKRERLWQELRVAVPATAGAIRFDHRADVTAIGLTALALVLGRPIADEEYPAKAPALLAGARARAAGGDDQPLPESLHAWIARALQLDGRQGFISATDAQVALEDALAEDSGFVAAPVALETFLSRYIAAMLEPMPVVASVKPVVQVMAPAVPPVTPLPPAPVVAAPIPTVSAPAVPVSAAVVPTIVVPPPAIPVAPVAAPAVTPLEKLPVRPAVVQAAEPVRAPQPLYISEAADESASFGALDAPFALQKAAVVEAAPAAHATPGPRDITELLKDFDLPSLAADAKDHAAPAAEPAHAIHESRPARTGSVSKKLVMAAAALVIIGGAGVYGARLYRKPAPPSLGSLSVQTNPPGVPVFVDGVAHGSTPARISLTAGSHLLELRGSGVPRVIPVSITAGAEASQYLELPRTPVSGSLLVQSDPAGAKVTIDGVEKGAAPVSVADLTPGEHEVTLQAEGGAPVRQKVVIQAGVTASILAPVATASAGPVSGWLTVKAPVTIELRENGRMIGTSDTDKIMLAAGRHDVELVNETLGYRTTRAVQVPAGKVASISLEMPQGSINLNASPWAEVFIDGKRVGETPIGNLSVTIGPHEVLFRHPQLGEKRQAVSVTLNAPVRLSVDMK